MQNDAEDTDFATSAAAAAIAATATSSAPQKRRRVTTGISPGGSKTVLRFMYLTKRQVEEIRSTRRTATSLAANLKARVRNATPSIKIPKKMFAQAASSLVCLSQSASFLSHVKLVELLKWDYRL